MSLNYFDSTAVADSPAALSTLNLASIVSIAGDSTYLDATAKIGPVYVYYTHQDGHQLKKLVHDSTGHTAPVSWSPYARDGTWQKTGLKIFDKDGAYVVIDRTSIGSSEDLTHSGGYTNLNIV